MSFIQSLQTTLNDSPQVIQKKYDDLKVRIIFEFLQGKKSCKVDRLHNNIDNVVESLKKEGFTVKKISKSHWRGYHFFWIITFPKNYSPDGIYVDECKKIKKELEEAAQKGKKEIFVEKLSEPLQTYFKAMYFVVDSYEQRVRIEFT